MDKLLEVQKSLKNQWDAMINSGRTPVIEYQIGEDDYLMVEISFVGEGLLFSFDDKPFPTCEVFFSCDVVKVLNNYQITFDEYVDNLDIYLQIIDREITEGFILPNGLYYCEG